MELLKELTQCHGVSGREEQVRKFISEKIDSFVDEIYTDTLGNLIAHKKGGGKKLMFAAHMDEVGIVVTFIDKNGFLRFAPVGGVEIKRLPGRRVVFENGAVGVINCEEEAFDKKASAAKLYIDIGAKSAEEAGSCVSVGDSAAFAGDFCEAGERIISKALDNRIACYILIETAKKQLASPNDVYYVFTVQEEVGGRGAQTAAYSLDADIAVNVDVTDTGDTPKASEMAVKLGGGAAVKVMDSSIICDAYVRSAITELAKNQDIKYQMEVMTDGGTDAGRIHMSRAGIKTGGVSVPTRYVHSPSEMVDKNDVNACIELISAIIGCQW